MRWLPTHGGCQPNLAWSRTLSFQMSRGVFFTTAEPHLAIGTRELDDTIPELFPALADGSLTCESLSDWAGEDARHFGGMRGKAEYEYALKELNESWVALTSAFERNHQIGAPASSARHPGPVPRPRLEVSPVAGHRPGPVLRPRGPRRCPR